MKRIAHLKHEKQRCMYRGGGSRLCGMADMHTDVRFPSLLQSDAHFRMVVSLPPLLPPPRVCVRHICYEWRPTVFVFGSPLDAPGQLVR